MLAAKFAGDGFLTNWCSDPPTLILKEKWWDAVAGNDGPRETCEMVPVLGNPEFSQTVTRPPNSGENPEATKLSTVVEIWLKPLDSTWGSERMTTQRPCMPLTVTGG